MSTSNFNDGDETPLDPAAERLQQKLRRLVFFSSLIMVGGLIAVFSVILYKVIGPGAKPAAISAEAIAATIAVGPDAKVRDIEFENGRMIVLIEEGTATALLQIDPATGRVLSRTDFVSR
ncbi:hypothetical protein [Breoghania sp. L-A4]|uniref:hypothetical protein n=1 Tax=Breoghania sp. L-A4 TaxID=2304600 RepID=UPI000E359268|nr:hypothetical protein [Breoghania sp. L-A4]AXS41772.1 hypothetical protein D1F64_19350 [Breoghania sp. L-A4]